MSTPWHLFEGIGIEVEAMVVDEQTLDIRPWADRAMIAECGDPVCELARGSMSWTNELAAHVIEVKTTKPAAGPDHLVNAFQDEWQRIRRHLSASGATLMPGPVHPWMVPATETVLWPHEQNDWYQMFDRIFDCRRHGWANLQSMHLNLPFCGDDEFARLHAAIRLLLPLLPGLAAGSPYLDGAYAGRLDQRLEVYRTNATALPAAVGDVIPEPVFSRAAYAETILEPLYRDLEPLDPEGLLREEWVNSRGAIARFDRGSIEIRVIDSQECARADLSVARIVWYVLRALTEERWSSLADQQSWSVPPLHRLFLSCLRDGEATRIVDRPFLGMFGIDRAVSVSELWTQLAEQCVPSDPSHDAWLDLYRRHGTLARRLLNRVGDKPTGDALRGMARDLVACHREGDFYGA